ncbi:unnamed protein product [Camellia sinensis]
MYWLRSSINTGSDILWVTYNSCNDCPQSSGHGIEFNFFDAASSTTASLSDLTQLEVPFVRQLFGSNCFRHLSVWDLRHRAIDGIFGFGQHDQSVISQLSSRGITPKTLLERRGQWWWNTSSWWDSGSWIQDPGIGEGQLGDDRPFSELSPLIAKFYALMGIAVVSKQWERRNVVSTEKKTLCSLRESCGHEFPGCDYRPPDRKNWMAGLNPEKVHLNKIVWPGTHDSGTNKIGIPCITRPFAQCQSLSIYHQLERGTRLLDIRVEEDRHVCHGILITYSVDVVINDIKRFLSETQSEIIILEIRTEFGHEDPPDFDSYLEDQLGEFLIHQDDQVFEKTIAELLPKRIICVWKPRKSPQPKAGGPLWSAGYLKDNWVDTDLPSTKFESNLKHLSDQSPVMSRKFFYRVENTVTPQADNPVLCVKPVTGRIHGYARLFITQCFSRGCADRLQVFSTDFIDEDFVDACVGLTHARVEGKA